MPEVPALCSSKFVQPSQRSALLLGQVSYRKKSTVSNTKPLEMCLGF